MKKTVVIVFGLPGCGKSYFASRLAKRMDAGYINSDILRRKLLKSSSYSKAEKANIYTVMLAEMKLIVQAEGAAVIDATFYLDNLRKKFESQTVQLDAEIYFIEIIADEDIIIERLKQPRKFSEADYSVYLKIREEFEPLMEDHLVIHSKRDNVDRMLDEALIYLGYKQGGNHG